MTDTEIFDFCEEHDIEVSFRFEKEINGCHLRIRRGAWQYATIITREQIECTKVWGSAVKELLCHIVEKLDREQNARKAELEEHHDSD